MSKRPDTRTPTEIKLDFYKEQTIELKAEYFFRFDKLEKKLDEIVESISNLSCDSHKTEIENIKQDNFLIKRMFYGIVGVILLTFFVGSIKFFFFSSPDFKTIIQELSKKSIYASESEANVKNSGTKIK